MQLEGNEIVLPARRSLPAPQVMFSGRQECVLCGHFTSVVKSGGPSAITWPQRSNAMPAAHIGAVYRSCAKNGLVQGSARNAEGGKWQASRHHLTTCVQSNRRKANGGKARQIDVQITKIIRRLAAHKLAADFVMRFGFALDQDHGPPGPREVRGHSAAGNTAADHQGLRRHRHQLFNRETQSRHGNTRLILAELCGTPAMLRRRCQSSGSKARAIEIGPSCCTNS